MSVAAAEAIGNSVPAGLPLPPPADLTIVVPTLNERDSVPLLVAGLGKALDGIAWEVVFVDDDPGTVPPMLCALARGKTNVRYLQRVGRRGLARPGSRTFYALVCSPSVRYAASARFANVGIASYLFNR